MSAPSRHCGDVYLCKREEGRLWRLKDPMLLLVRWRTADPLLGGHVANIRRVPGGAGGEVGA
jgi:hypothetical protein